MPFIVIDNFIFWKFPFDSVDKLSIKAGKFLRYIRSIILDSTSIPFFYEFFHRFLLTEM